MVTYRKMTILQVFGEFLFLFGLLAWIYGVLVQFFFPVILTDQLSHLTPWLRVDTFTMIGFAAAGIGFLIARLTKKLGN